MIPVWCADDQHKAMTGAKEKMGLYPQGPSKVGSER